MADRTTRGENPACWPTPAQELLFECCFVPDERRVETLDAYLQQAGATPIDPVSEQFLSLLLYRWAGQVPVEELHRRAYLSQVAIWRANQRRFLTALSLAGSLQEAGIECLFLKGLALTICHYRHPAVRAMEDVDVLVRPGDVAAAVSVLERAGWAAEEGASGAEILRARRVRHAWQFRRGADESSDLHWHPVVRCFAPRIAELFWQGARTAKLLDKPVGVPCATDLLFHACTHGLQWSWTPQVRWVPDALSILRDPEAIDWSRLLELAALGEVNIRLHHALDYLRASFEAQVPRAVIEALQSAASAWELREYRLLQKDCPLNPKDRILWHITNFRRIRRYDADWAGRLWTAGFLEYVRSF